MKRSCLLAVVCVAASVAAAPVQAFAPALVFGLIAASMVGSAAVGVAANQARGEVWVYTDKLGWVGGKREDVAAIDSPLATKPGTSRRIGRACRDAIAKNA